MTAQQISTPRPLAIEWSGNHLQFFCSPNFTQDSSTSNSQNGCSIIAIRSVTTVTINNFLYPILTIHYSFTRSEILLSSAIRQKGESQNECYKKAKHAKFSEKRTCVCVSRGKKCSFFRKFGVLVTPILNYRRYLLSPSKIAGGFKLQRLISTFSSLVTTIASNCNRLMEKII